MKNFTKLFLAVVALFAYACVTDTTEDLGVQLGGQTTEITISLEESRTQLGEKAGNVYPLHWSEGDKISVNGVESAEAAISQGNPSVATFTVNGALAVPYCIAYPAAPAGQVLFAENQTHAGDTTFGKGVSTMYAYGDSTGAELNHLTGVLKIGITGSANLTYAQISTADRAPIAGAFDFDFEKGEAKATTASKHVINYSFPTTADAEGLALSNTPQYIHVAVPAGEYDEIYVTLYDNQGGVMYATVKADDKKPLAAGKIREFTNTIAYEPNAAVFVIKDKDSLKEFAAQAATLTKDVLFVADVDMTGEAWTPIEGYAGTVYGNGYAIKGMTAPLFGTTHASFKGLHLKDVDIEETQLTTVGALARLIILSDANLPVVEHCSVTGKVILNNTTVPHTTISGTTDYNYVSVGGLIGRANGVHISDCVNYAQVEIKQSMPTGNTKSLYPSIGGVLGFADIATQESTNTAVTTDYYDLTNYGDVKATVSSYTGVTSTEAYSPLQPYVGGVVGTSAANNANCDFRTLKNYGNVSLSGKVGSGAALGGVMGYVKTYTGSHMYNYGKVSVVDAEIFYIYMGGCVGIGAKSTALTELHNYGEVYTDENSTCGYIVCGGVLGYQSSNHANAESTNSYLRNSTNSGPLNISHNDLADELHNGTNTFYYRIGGIAGWTQNYIENCNNLEGGKISCKADLFDCTDMFYRNCIGGLVGYKTVSKIHNSHNDATVDVKVNLSTKEGTNIDYIRVNVGGIVGYSHLPVTDVTNNGNVTYEGTCAGRLIMGGVCGVCNTVSDAIPLNENLVNNATVTFKKGSSLGHYLMIGGVAGYINKNKNCTNNGAVIIEDNVTWGNANSYIAGTAGFVCGLTENMTNNAPLTVGKDCSHPGAEYEYIGGTIGFLYSGDADGLYNTEKGVITIGKSDYTGYVLLGGCLGAAPAWDNKHTAQVNFYIKNCENRGAINYYAIQTTNSTHYVGGVFGYIYEQTLNDKLIAPDVSYADNYGPIKIESDNLYAFKAGGISSYIGGLSNFLHNHETGTIHIDVTTRQHCSIGGISQAIKDTANDITNDGDITIDGSIGGTLYIGGCIRDAHNYKRTRCNNNGNILVNASAGTGIFIGGITYDGGAKMYFIDCHNTGDIIMSETSSAKSYVALGGIVGKIESTSTSNYNVLDGCSNSGNIIIKGNPASEGYCSAGGAYGFMYGKSKVLVDKGFTNSGDIIFEGNHTATYGDASTYKTRRSIDLGGFAGWVLETLQWTSSGYPTWKGNIVNTGAIKHIGKTTSGVRVGGIFAILEGSAPTITDGSFINTGDIVCTGEYSSNAAPFGVGGIAGVTFKGISNGKAFCNVNAINYPTAGMITGSPRSSDNVVSNCQLGGTITLSSQGVENGDGDMIYTPIIETIDESNFQNYIYGGTTAWDGTNYDGCSFLSVAPTI